MSKTKVPQLSTLQQRYQYALQVLEDIPDSRINLQDYNSTVSTDALSVKEVVAMFDSITPPQASKKTVADGGGWLALHPHFMEAGLIANAAGVPTYDGSVGEAALVKFFDRRAVYVFARRPFEGFRTHYDPIDLTGPDGEPMPDKSILIHRLRVVILEIAREQE